MNGPIEFTDHQLQAMAASYRAGASLDAVGLEFGISKTAVVRRLSAMGVERRPVGFPPGTRSRAKGDEARRLLASGLSKQEIARKMHVCLRTVYRHLAV